MMLCTRQKEQDSRATLRAVQKTSSTQGDRFTAQRHRRDTPRGVPRRVRSGGPPSGKKQSGTTGRKRLRWAGEPQASVLGTQSTDAD